MLKIRRGDQGSSSQVSSRNSKPPEGASDPVSARMVVPQMSDYLRKKVEASVKEQLAKRKSTGSKHAKKLSLQRISYVGQLQPFSAQQARRLTKHQSYASLSVDARPRKGKLPPKKDLREVELFDNSYDEEDDYLDQEASVDKLAEGEYIDEKLNVHMMVVKRENVAKINLQKTLQNVRFSDPHFEGMELINYQIDSTPCDWTSIAKNIFCKWAPKSPFYALQNISTADDINFYKSQVLRNARIDRVSLSPQTRRVDMKLCESVQMKRMSLLLADQPSFGALPPKIFVSGPIDSPMLRKKLRKERRVAFASGEEKSPPKLYSRPEERLYMMAYQALKDPLNARSGSPGKQYLSKSMEELFTQTDAAQDHQSQRTLLRLQRRKSCICSLCGNLSEKGVVCRANQFVLDSELPQEDQEAGNLPKIARQINLNFKRRPTIRQADSTAFRSMHALLRRPTFSTFKYAQPSLLSQNDKDDIATRSPVLRQKESDFGEIQDDEKEDDEAKRPESRPKKAADKDVQKSMTFSHAFQRNDIINLFTGEQHVEAQTLESSHSSWMNQTVINHKGRSAKEDQKKDQVALFLRKRIQNNFNLRETDFERIIKPGPKKKPRVAYTTQASPPIEMNHDLGQPENADFRSRNSNTAQTGPQHQKPKSFAIPSNGTFRPGSLHLFYRSEHHNRTSNQSLDKNAVAERHTPPNQQAFNSFKDPLESVKNIYKTTAATTSFALSRQGPGRFIDRASAQTSQQKLRTPGSYQSIKPMILNYRHQIIRPRDTRFSQTSPQKPLQAQTVISTPNPLTPLAEVSPHQSILLKSDYRKLAQRQYKLSQLAKPLTKLEPE